MLTIQDKLVVSLPDDVPLPPGAVVIEAPDDYEENKAAYRVEGKKLVRREEERDDRPPRVTLTGDDLARIKEALEQGRI